MKRILSLAAVFVLCMACLMAGCGKNDPLPQDPPEELPPDQINAELPEGLACRPIEGRGEYEVYVADEEKVKALSGTVVLPNFYEGFPITKLANEIFLDCELIEEVILPQYLLQIGYGAFARSEIVRLTIPESCVEIGSSAMRECTRLQTVAIPNSITNILIYTFLNCTKLESIRVLGRSEGAGPSKGITLPDSLKQICMCAFSGCVSLGPTLVIPQSVNRIDAYAFENSGVRAVMLPKNVSYIGGESLFYSTIYTDGEANDLWTLGNHETNVFYNSVFHYDGKTPYVYSIDGTEFLNRPGSKQLMADYDQLENVDNYYSEFPPYLPFREGYEFKGWSKTEGSKEVDFVPEPYDPEKGWGLGAEIFSWLGIEPYLTSLGSFGEMRRLEPHETLYAVWEPIA